jgi:hypothetical protein
VKTDLHVDGDMFEGLKALLGPRRVCRVYFASSIACLGGTARSFTSAH